MDYLCLVCDRENIEMNLNIKIILPLYVKKMIKVYIKSMLLIILIRVKLIKY